MQRTLTAPALALLCALSMAAEEAGQPQLPPPPATHQEAAWQLVQLLRDTDTCLASCTDAAAVQAALPRLRELADRAATLKRAQNSLPDPTKQDYSVGHELLSAFTLVWKSVREHIDRLEQAGLMSPELRDILRVAPPDNSASAPTPYN